MGIAKQARSSAQEGRPTDLPGTIENLRPGCASIRWLAVLCLIGLSIGGCQPEVDPASVTARVVAYGEYEIRNGLPTLIEQTSTIACAQGRIFGLDYRIEVADGDFGIVPVDFRWIHPELSVPERRLWGTEAAASPSNPTLGWGDSVIEGRALWTLEHPDELVSGRYEFQLRLRDDDDDDAAVILTHPFDIQGC